MTRFSLRLTVLLLAGAILAAGALGTWGWFPALWSRSDSSENAPRPATVASNPFLPAGVEDASWPFLRGPNYDGHSTEIHLADAWPSEGPPVLWTRTLGQGYSGFVAEGNRVYTQYQSLAGQFVTCLDADTGEPIWEYRYDWPYEATGIYPGPRATPTLAGGNVYFAAPSGLVGCLTGDGSLVWSVNVTKKLNGKGTEFGYSCSPVIRKGRVLLPVGGEGASMVALDAKVGSALWQSGDDSASYTPAMPIRVEGREQVIGYLENALVGCDLESGKPLWRMELSQGYNEHAAWPIYAEPHLWISAAFRAGSQLLTVTGGDQPGVKEVWHNKLLSNDVCSSALHEGFLYGFDLRDIQAKTHRPSRGTFRCLEFLTGKERWATDAIGQASVIVADGKLILLNDKGELILARADSEKYDELARVSVLGGEITWTPPTLHRGRVYVRNHSRAACIFVGEADRLENHTGAEPLKIEDIPQSTYRDLAAILGVEPEYALDVPSPQWLRDWYLISVVLLTASAAPALLVMLLNRLMNHDGMHRLELSRMAFWLLAFFCGAVGTTALSLWRNDFVFTWPLSLFILFHATVNQVRLDKAIEPTTGKWQPRVVVLLFGCGCAGYYFLCRRLSLATEWAFLCGFPVALPLSFVSLWCVRKKRTGLIAELLISLAAFSAFYWASVSVLLWRCQVAS